MKQPDDPLISGPAAGGADGPARPVRGAHGPDTTGRTAPAEVEPGVHVLALLLLVCGLGFLGYAAFGLAKGYSLWTDELFSVTAARMPFARAFGLYLNDVHPPLYQLLLAGWTAVFGTSEMAVRALSLLFVGLSFLAMATLAGLLGRRHALVLGIVYLSNWLVFYYAQEARSYALLLMLSACCFALFLRRAHGWLFPALVLLGLTHYFGTLQAMVYLLWLLIEDWRSGARWLAVTVSGAMLLVWPLIYLLHGNAREIIGGRFWIESTPATGLIEAAGAAFPVVTGLIRASGALAPLAAVAGLALLAALVRRGSATDAQRLWAIKAAFVTGLPVLLAAAVNAHTPITTLRNFIILVPGASFLVSMAIMGALRMIGSGRAAVAAGLGLALLIGLAQVQTANNLATKLMPREDWKRVAALIDREPGAVYFFKGEEFPDAIWPDDLPQYYLPASRPVRGIREKDLKGLKAGSILMFGHLPTTGPGGTCRNALLDALDGQRQPYRALFVRQYRQCRNGFVVLLGPPRRQAAPTRISATLD